MGRREQKGAGHRPLTTSKGPVAQKHFTLPDRRAGEGTPLKRRLPSGVQQNKRKVIGDGVNTEQLK